MSVRTRLRAAIADVARSREDLDDARREITGHVDHIGKLCRDKARLDDENRALIAEITQLRRDLAEARVPDIGWLTERRELRRRVLVLLTANARLDARLADLQRANDYLSREAVDHAGTLKPLAEVTA